jgi:PhnB protein
MGCDSLEADGQATRFGSTISLSVKTDSKLEVDRLFKELSHGGQTKMSMNETFWGSYFGVLIDKFGVQWMISFELNTK